MEITTIRNKLHYEVEIPHSFSAGFGMTTLFFVWSVEKKRFAMANLFFSTLYLSTTPCHSER